MRPTAVTVLIPVVSCLALSGCGPAATEAQIGKPALIINGLQLSAEELRDDAVAAQTPHLGAAAQNGEPAWLEMVIERELLVQEAQRLGLDRQPAFMKTIERFWKEALIKSLMERQLRAFRSQARDDAQVQQLLDAWVQDLRRQARIQIDREAVQSLP